MRVLASLTMILLELLVSVCRIWKLRVGTEQGKASFQYILSIAVHFQCNKLYRLCTFPFPLEICTKVALPRYMRIMSGSCPRMFSVDYAN